jgi:hypothetical protein
MESAESVHINAATAEQGGGGAAAADIADKSPWRVALTKAQEWYDGLQTADRYTPADRALFAEKWRSWTAELESIEFPDHPSSRLAGGGMLWASAQSNVLTDLHGPVRLANIRKHIAEKCQAPKDAHVSEGDDGGGAGAAAATTS